MSNLRRPLPGAAVPSVVLVLALGVAACTAGVLPTMPNPRRRRRGRRPDGWCRGNQSSPRHRRATESARGGHRRGRHLHAVRDLHAAERAVLRRHRQRLLRNARLRHLSGRPGLRRKRLRGRRQLRGAGLSGRDRYLLRHRGERLRPGPGLRRLRHQPGLRSGVCVPGAGCVPLTCTTATGRYCGTIGDGCGGTLPCGDCPTGSTCGGAGVANTCAPTNCTPGTCMAAGGARYCGSIGDGCGRTLDCGGCTGTAGLHLEHLPRCRAACR